MNSCGKHCKSISNFGTVVYFLDIQDQVFFKIIYSSGATYLSMIDWRCTSFADVLQNPVAIERLEANLLCCYDSIINSELRANIEYPVLSLEEYFLFLAFNLCY